MLCLVPLALADIPVHCLHRQTLGTWTFRLGSNDHDDTLTCGHKLPDAVMTMVDNRVRFDNPNFKVSKDYEVTLTEPNVATDAKGNKGTWTMVYDEGFEVRIAGKTFFSFFVYVPKVASPTPTTTPTSAAFAPKRSRAGTTISTTESGAATLGRRREARASRRPPSRQSCAAAAAFRATFGPH